MGQHSPIHYKRGHQDGDPGRERLPGGRRLDNPPWSICGEWGITGGERGQREGRRVHRNAYKQGEKWLKTIHKGVKGADAKPRHK